MPGRSGQGSSPVPRNETKSHAEARALAGVLLHFQLAQASLDVTLAYLKGKDAESEAGACEQQQLGAVWLRPKSRTAGDREPTRPRHLPFVPVDR